MAAVFHQSAQVLVLTRLTLWWNYNTASKSSTFDSCGFGQETVTVAKQRVRPSHGKTKIYKQSFVHKCPQVTLKPCQRAVSSLSRSKSLQPFLQNVLAKWTPRFDLWQAGISILHIFNTSTAALQISVFRCYGLRRALLLDSNFHREPALKIANWK